MSGELQTAGKKPHCASWQIYCSRSAKRRPKALPKFTFVFAQIVTALLQPETTSTALAYLCPVCFCSRVISLDKANTNVCSQVSQYWHLHISASLIFIQIYNFPPSTVLSLLTRKPTLFSKHFLSAVCHHQNEWLMTLSWLFPKLPPQMTLPGFRGIWQISPWMFWEHITFVPIVIFG